MASRPTETQITAAGKAAWQELRNRLEKDFEPWIPVIRLVGLGRAKLLKALHLNEPKGGKYNKEFNKFLEQHDMSDLKDTTRWACGKLAPYLDDVVTWREMVRRDNYSRFLTLYGPQVVWREYSKDRGLNKKEKTPEEEAEAERKKREKVTVKQLADYDLEEVAEILEDALGESRMEDLGLMYKVNNPNGEDGILTPNMSIMEMTDVLCVEMDAEKVAALATSLLDRIHFDRPPGGGKKDDAPPDDEPEPEPELEPKAEGDEPEDKVVPLVKPLDDGRENLDFEPVDELVGKGAAA